MKMKQKLGKQKEKTKIMTISAENYYSGSSKPPYKPIMTSSTLTI